MFYILKVPLLPPPISLVKNICLYPPEYYIFIIVAVFCKSLSVNFWAKTVQAHLTCLKLFSQQLDIFILNILKILLVYNNILYFKILKIFYELVLDKLSSMFLVVVYQLIKIYCYHQSRKAKDQWFPNLFFQRFFVLLLNIEFNFPYRLLDSRNFLNYSAYMLY